MEEAHHCLGLSTRPAYCFHEGADRRRRNNGPSQAHDLTAYEEVLAGGIPSTAETAGLLATFRPHAFRSGDRCVAMRPVPCSR
eukprot:6979767-Alexandrium_andersonii.AAC.1